MNFLKNISIKVWIVSIAALLLTLLLTVSLFSLASVKNIAQEITGIAEEDAPITENLTDIAVHQLEQAIHFERAFRYGGLLNKGAETQDTQDTQSTRDLFDREVADFHNRTTQVEKEITRAREFMQQISKRAHNQEKTKEFALIDTGLKKVGAEHKDYATHANRVFALLAADNQNEAALLGEKVEAEEGQLDKELALLLTQVEKFSETLAVTMEEHEARAINVLTILSVIAVLGGLILSFLAIRYAVNPLLAERLAQLVAAEKESKTLNNSIIGLLKTVAALSQRDLTVKATVTEDVTGSVADALNLMTMETAKVLNQVNVVSDDVSTTSISVKQQSDLVTELAQKEREVVDSASQTLQRTTASMQEVAELTERSNQAAEQAIAATDKAFATVNDTVQGINDTRDTIRETEKRIKRLGERSQEISTAVNLINTIAERTHILALNASMHAASAGEAGRGFAVVADEVQRLAESSRDATAQIATLVKNIQVETSETVNTMNDTITQVVGGSRLAQQAGMEMQTTQKNTAELVAQMREIAEKVMLQVSELSNMEDSIAQIRETTVETSKQLGEQANATSELVTFSSTLVSAVSVFKLPEQATAR